MVKALIQNTRICEIVDDDKTFPVHSDLKWVDVPDGTTDKDTYVDSKVVKYVASALTTMEKIFDIEAQITPRRIRDHLLGTGGDFIKDKEAEIAALRNDL